jgi:hypothetical protein
MSIKPLYVEKLLRLIEQGVITVNDINDEDYKTEVETRLTAE